MLEIWCGGTRREVPLSAEHTSLGRAPSNDIVIEDIKVSALHATIDRFASGSVIRDLGSANGTFVNGKRVDQAVLHPGDQIQVGTTNIVFRGQRPEAIAKTDPVIPAPLLTRRERDVLVALCRPLLEGDLFCEPSSSAHIARTLLISEDGVKKHLARLYPKFSIFDETGTRRRTQLANAAIDLTP